MEYYYNRSCGKTKFNLVVKRKAKKVLFWLVGDKVGIITNILSVGFMVI